MNLKLLLIGLMLMLCITPAAAVSGTDFEIATEIFKGWPYYTYNNTADPGERYICISTLGTCWLNSLVTFKPADIPDAPTMVVDTSEKCFIRLPWCVDNWEIKYYSRFLSLYEPNDKYLKNAGVVNLKERMGKHVLMGYNVRLELSTHQRISILRFDHLTNHSEYNVYYIPDVD